MKFKYVLGGIFIFLFFLVGTTPANLIATALKDQMRGIQLVGLSGSVWEGEIDEVKIRRESVRNLGWSFNFLNLLTGKLGVDLTVADPKAKGSLQLAVGFSGVPEFSNVQLAIPLKQIEPYIRLRGMTIDLNGTVNTNLSSLVIVNNNITELLGTARVRSLAVKASGRSAFVNLDQRFGDYEIQFNEILEKSVAFEIKGIKDVLSLQATGTLDNKLFEIKGSVTDQLPPQLGILNAMLKPQGPGRKAFQYAGRIPI